MRLISILVPTYNEVDNVGPLSEAIENEFTRYLQAYDYELIFIDNDSQDGTREKIREVVERDSHVKAIFNAKNFGQFNSPYYGLMQTNGACTILLCADFQDPIELIHQFVMEWEKGYKIVIGQKTKSQENRLVYELRTCYYKLIKRFSNVDQIEHFTGFGLYDKSFIDVIKTLDDPTPFLRGIVAEYGYKIKIIPYEQQLRRSGKTSNNFSRLYDAAMLSITSYTKFGLRIATFIGGVIAIISVIVAFVYLVLKIMYWDRFVAGTIPILLGMCFLGAVQLVFLGLIGEYILSINQRVMKRPLVIEAERIGDWEGQKE